MPYFEIHCEVCGQPKRAWRPADQPPRFCSRGCRDKGFFGFNAKPARFPITPEIHAAIERVYKRDTGNGQVAALARRIGYPRWRISRYAISQGWIAKQQKEPDWSGDEEAILERSAHLCPEVIQRKLREKGFHRSVTGIVMKRKRERFLQNLNGYSACKVAEGLGVDMHFVRRAIKAGKLKARYRGTKRTPQQGGDQYYITERAVRDYIVGNINEIDIRKVDKYWFVGLLAAASDSF